MAAIVIAATDARGAGSPASDRRPVRQAGAEAPSPSWELPLRALMEAPAARTQGKPLAIELALRARGLPGRGAPRLMARLMRPERAAAG